MTKQSTHSQDRGLERLKLSPKSVDAIQKAVDQMWFSKGHTYLNNDKYYLNIRDPQKNILGYAALKRINASGKRPRLILATILDKNMRPRRSQDISHLVDSITYHEKFTGLPPVPNNG